MQCSASVAMRVFLPRNSSNPGSVAIGDRVYALGYPLGANSIRVTEGIVSASEYRCAVYNAYIIQTDAALKPRQQRRAVDP